MAVKLMSSVVTLQNFNKLLVNCPRKPLFSPFQSQGTVKKSSFKFISTQHFLQHPPRQNKVYKFPKLTPQEVCQVLRENETSCEFNEGPVKSCDSNFLPSNSPIEDRQTEAKCALTNSYLFCVFDGHGGDLCSNYASSLLPYYLALSLLPLNVLAEYVTSHNDKEEILKILNKNFDVVESIQKFHKENLKQYAMHLLSSRTRDSEFSIKNAFESAFSALDTNISQSALHGNNGKPHTEMLDVALSGSCACVAHIDGIHLQVANVGDCRAVLGTLNEENKWRATVLTRDHNTDNLDELKRVMDAHPIGELNSVIKNERLLGQLIPLRALGDFMYKWSTNILKKVVIPRIGHHLLPPNYLTPPYLISEPEFFQRTLSSRDKFLIIASDGLWETLMPHQVVKLVGKYMSGKQTLDPVKLPRRNLQLKEINQLLLQRKEGLLQKPIDTNAATHLIRNALGGTEYGVDHGKLSSMLSIPKEFVRGVRDDITIIVIFFDSDFFRNIKIKSLRL